VTWIDKCPWCGQRHTTTYLCAPAAQMLQLHAAQRAAQGLDPMTVDFPEMVQVSGPGPQLKGDLKLDNRDSIMRRVTVMSSGTEVDGIADLVPTLVITGVDFDGKPLPRWIYLGTPAEIRNVVELVRDRAEHAISSCYPGRKI